MFGTWIDMLKATNTAIEGEAKALKRLRGTGSLFRRARSPFWWVGYHRSGKLYRESTHTDNVRKAQRFLQRRLGEVASDNFVTPQTARTKVGELAELVLQDHRQLERKSVEDAKSRWLLHLEPFFGHRRAIGVTSDLIGR